MATVLWGLFIVLLLLLDSNAIPRDSILREPFPLLILLIGAIVTTVKGKKKKQQQEANEKEKRAAAYTPPTGSTAAGIRATVASSQELEKREQERRRQHKEALTSQIIEDCKKAARDGEKKRVFVMENYGRIEDRGLFSRTKHEHEYDIDCPTKDLKELQDELVRHGFLVSFTRREASLTWSQPASGSIDAHDHYYSVETLMTVRW